MMVRAMITLNKDEDHFQPIDYMQMDTFQGLFFFALLPTLNWLFMLIVSEFSKKYEKNDHWTNKLSLV